MKIGPTMPPLVPRFAPPASPAKEESPKDGLTLSRRLRFANDAGSVVSGLKTIGICAANLINLPAGFQPYLEAGNWGSTALGVVSCGIDVHNAKKLFSDPQATKMDKIVDIAHIGVSDVLAKACGAVPLFASLHNPVALSVFVGGQLLGVGSDVYRIVYDVKHHRKSVRAGDP